MDERLFYRALPRIDAAFHDEAYRLADGWCWFDQVEVLGRGLAPRVIPAHDVPQSVLMNMIDPRPTIAGLDMGRLRLMGIVNVTPDSFSDGGLFDDADVAVGHAVTLLGEGADILDVGGESTRPDADDVSEAAELDRVLPVVKAISQECACVVSIDTRKSAVAKQALAAGAQIVNDVSAMGFDGDMADIVVKSGAPVCLMHAKGAPKTMQNAPQYDDVLLDIYEYLEERIALALAIGISRDQIIIDPGIGFGKTLAHNILILQRISLFHSLGVPILLGASRKRFIGTIAGVSNPRDRMPGSVAVALAAAAQGVQIMRIHDVGATHQALALWRAVTGQSEVL